MPKMDGVQKQNPLRCRTALHFRASLLIVLREYLIQNFLQMCFDSLARNNVLRNNTFNC